MQTIRCIRTEQGETSQTLYAVELSDGQKIARLRRSDLSSYTAFELALAFRGVRVSLAADEYQDFDHTPRSWRRSKWLNLIANAIAAGEQQAEEDAIPPRQGRRSRRRGGQPG